MTDKGKSLAGAGVIVVTLAVAIFLVGSPTVSATNGNVVIDQVTITNTATTLRNFTSTESITVSVANTVTSYTTVTAQLPANITMSGTAVTKGIGTKAQSVQFDSSGGLVYGADVVSGAYSLTLPNPGIYTVVIDYSGLPVGGSCSVGTFVLSTTGTSYTVSLSC